MHDLMPVLLALLVAPVMTWAGWTGYRESFHPKNDSGTERDKETGTQ